MSGDPLAPLREQWLDLMRLRLPEAAKARSDWPVSQDHCFGRIILDAVCGAPWRTVLKAPAWRSMDERQLRAAIDLGEAILSGEADLGALNARSLRLRQAGRQ